MLARIVRPLALAGITLVVACGSSPKSEPEAGTAAAPLSQSGSGRFQAASGLCIVPAAASPLTGTRMLLGACAAASANKFTLGPSIGVGDALLGQTKAPTVRTGSQGTLMVHGLCLEGDPSTGLVLLKTCQTTCQTIENTSDVIYPTDPCVPYANGAGLTNGSANGRQEWTWSEGQIRSAFSPQKCLTVSSLSSGSALGLLDCNSNSSTLQSFLPLDFDLMFASGIPAASQYAGPHPAVAPLLAPPSATKRFTCLDVYLDFETVVSNPLDAFQCNGTDAQWFHFDETGLLRTRSNTCVGAPGGGAGAAVRIEGCTGSSDQKWGYVSLIHTSTRRGWTFTHRPSAG